LAPRGGFAGSRRIGLGYLGRDLGRIPPCAHGGFHLRDGSVDWPADFAGICGDALALEYQAHVGGLGALERRLHVAGFLGSAGLPRLRGMGLVGSPGLSAARIGGARRICRQHPRHLSATTQPRFEATGHRGNTGNARARKPAGEVTAGRGLRTDASAVSLEIVGGLGIVVPGHAAHAILDAAG